MAEMERYIKQELLYQTRAYDLYQAFDEDSGELKFYYELRAEAENFGKLIPDSEAYFAGLTGKCSVVITKIQPGGSVMQLLFREKQIKFSRELLLKWIGQLVEELHSDPVRSPTVDNIFVNTRTAHAYFVPGSFLPLIAPRNEFKSTPSLRIEDLRQLSTPKSTLLSQIQPLVENPCEHDNQQCDACKCAVSLAKLFVDQQAAEMGSLHQIYQSCEEDEAFSELFNVVSVPHCSKCCVLSQAVAQPEKYPSDTTGDVIIASASQLFIFGLSIAQIFCNYYIENFIGVMFALSQVRTSFDIEELIPGFRSLPDSIIQLVLDFTRPEADLLLISQEEPLRNHTSTPLEIKCEFKARRSSTMTISWTIGSSKINQYILLDDSPEAVVEEFLNDHSEYAFIGREQLLSCLQKNGSW